MENDEKIEVDWKKIAASLYDAGEPDKDDKDEVETVTKEEYEVLQNRLAQLENNLASRDAVAVMGSVADLGDAETLKAAISGETLEIRASALKKIVEAKEQEVLMGASMDRRLSAESHGMTGVEAFDKEVEVIANRLKSQSTDPATRELAKVGGK